MSAASAGVSMPRRRTSASTCDGVRYSGGRTASSTIASSSPCSERRFRAARARSRSTTSSGAFLIDRLIGHWFQFGSVLELIGIAWREIRGNEPPGPQLTMARPTKPSTSAAIASTGRSAGGAAPGDAGGVDALGLAADDGGVGIGGVAGAVGDAVDSDGKRGLEPDAREGDALGGRDGRDGGALGGMAVDGVRDHRVAGGEAGGGTARRWWRRRGWRRRARRLRAGGGRWGCGRTGPCG